MLSHNNLRDEGMKHLARCTFLENLVELKLYGNYIGDEGIKNLGGCNFMKKFEKINLKSNKIENIMEQSI